MTNNEKELELVQKCLDDWPYAATRVIDIMKRLEQVKALLKEQEAKPVKVVKVADDYKLYYCPRCDRPFCDFYYAKPKFCDKCGQEVKWDG